MLKFNQKQISSINFEDITISVFDSSTNFDSDTIESFGEEWKKFDSFDSQEIKKIGDEYFDIVSDGILSKETTIALDLGCGSGRWSLYLADKVKFIEAIDPSDAVLSSVIATKNKENIRVSKASADNIPFENNSFDFIMSLGVLHHIPDTNKAIEDLVPKLKSKGYFLLYLYYSLDNRSILYKFIFKVSNVFRKLIASSPTFLKKLFCDIIAFIVYLPLVLLAKIVSLFSLRIGNKMPLSYYIGKSLKVIRNDSLDRFGTPLEQRFSKEQINSMLEKNGFHNIKFSDKMPFWHVLAQKK